MIQIQTWPFGSKYGRGMITHTVGDPVKASAAIKEHVEGRAIREIVVWRADHTVSQAKRESPDAPWIMVKGPFPELL
jgi:hypothetical protein